jgi:hypothetical protein
VVEAAGMAPPQGIFRTADRRGELSHGGRGFYIGPTGCNSGSDIEQQTPNLSKAFVSGTLLPVQGPTIRPARLLASRWRRQTIFRRHGRTHLQSSLLAFNVKWVWHSSA